MKSVLSLFVSLVLIGCATTLPSQGALKKLIIGNFSNVRGVLEIVEIGKFNKEQNCWPVKAKVFVGHTFGRKTIQIANYSLHKSDDGAWAVSQSEEVKSGIVDEGALKTWETDAKEKEMVTEEVIGYYMVKKGESLSRIAEREDVFGDPLKWPILYWLNMDELDKLQLAEDPPDRKIPDLPLLELIALKPPAAGQARTPQFTVPGKVIGKSDKEAEIVASASSEHPSAPEMPPGGTFAINLASFRQKQRADRYVEELKKLGIHAYRWEANLPEKGRWYRVSIGGFLTLKEAKNYTKQLRQQGISDMYITRLQSSRSMKNRELPLLSGR